MIERLFFSPLTADLLGAFRPYPALGTIGFRPLLARGLARKPIRLGTRTARLFNDTVTQILAEASQVPRGMETVERVIAAEERISVGAITALLEGIPVTVAGERRRWVVERPIEGGRAKFTGSRHQELIFDPDPQGLWISAGFASGETLNGVRLSCRSDRDGRVTTSTYSFAFDYERVDGLAVLLGLEGSAPAAAISSRLSALICHESGQYVPEELGEETVRIRALDTPRSVVIRLHRPPSRKNQLMSLKPLLRRTLWDYAVRSIIRTQ